METILAINPGSTSTKIALYEDQIEVLAREIAHSAESLSIFPRVLDQKEFRSIEIEKAVTEANKHLSDLTVVVGRGGLLRPLKAGTYLINSQMVRDAATGTYGEHASNLGCMIAFEIASKLHIPAYISDPVSVDEFEDFARVTGLKDIHRIALDHPLNVRAVIRNYCEDSNRNFSEIVAVVAHLGGGISVSAFRKGRIIDSNNANESGPFSATRAGSLPAIDVVNMCFSGQYTWTSLKDLLLKKAGLISYLQTNDLRVALKRMENGDSYAKEVIEALCYQVSKEIGGASAILAHRPEVILLTGGMSYSPFVVDQIKRRVSFIAPTIAYPGSDELKALSLAAFRVKNNLETVLTY